MGRYQVEASRVGASAVFTVTADSQEAAEPTLIKLIENAGMTADSEVGNLDTEIA